MAYIRTDLIDANPLAPREIYTSSMIRDRAEALRTQGQHDPIHVIPNPDHPGRYIICDGWTRVQACMEHEVLQELLAEIHEGLTLEQAAWFGFQQNEERQQHCDFDRALFYEKLIKTGRTAADVARQAKISKSRMSYYQSFSKLPGEVIELVRMHPDKFSYNVAHHLAKLHDHSGIRRTVTLAAKFAEQNQTMAWLISQVQAILHPNENKPAASSRQVRYANGFYKQRGDAFEVSIVVAPSKKKDFANALETLLATVGEELPDAHEDNLLTNAETNNQGDKE